MARDTELDRLHEVQERAYNDKQEAFRRWHERLPEQERLYEQKKNAKSTCDEAKAEMNREFEELHRYDFIWDEYNRIKEINNPRITSLKSRADYLAYQMKDAFQRASDAYNYGDKSLAPGYSAEGRQYKDELESVNREVSELCSEVKSARMRAESYKKNSSAFRSAQSRFREAKREQERAQNELNAYVAETKHLKTAFEEAKKRHLHAQELFQERLAVVKAANKRKQNEDDLLMDQAGIPFYYRKDCKIKKDADGSVNFYFGGIGEKDGFGHGHVSMDSGGKVTYNRDVFDKHGKENYTDYQERQKAYQETHFSTSWEVQDDNKNYRVLVKGGYLYNHPKHGKDPTIERTDFLLFPKDEPGHAHVSIGEDTNGEVKIWHDVEERGKESKK